MHRFSFVKLADADAVDADAVSDVMLLLLQLQLTGCCDCSS